MAVLAKRTDVTEEQRTQIKLEFVDRLTEARQYEQAGDLTDHSKDFEGAFERYLKGHCFEKAVKLCMQAE
jgi:hypothetical protein